MTRTDSHRPSAIDPTEYEFVGFEYQKIEGLGDAIAMQAEREAIRAHKERTGDTYSKHAHGGSCHICGAHAVYTALFYHEPTRSYIVTGMDCAQLIDMGVDGSKFRRAVQDAREAKAGKAKAQALLSDAGLSAAWEVFNDTADTAKDSVTVRDIVGRLVKYGSVSEAQMRFVGTLMARIANRPAIEAARKAEHDAAAPLPAAGRIVIRGRVVSVKSNDFGTRILVLHADGWKAWGSLPAAFDAKEVRGALVEFSATIRPSDEDPKFGFFSRPAKMAILEAAQAAA